MAAIALLAVLLSIAGLMAYRIFTRRPAVRVEYYNEPGDYLSYGEAKAVPGCKCRASNVLYWELSPAVTDDCPIHGPGEVT